MIICLFLTIFLPGLNREGCKDKESPFTCADLEKGEKVLQDIIASNPNKYEMSIEGDKPGFEEDLFFQLLTVVKALAHGAIPTFNRKIDSKSMKTPYINGENPKSGWTKRRLCLIPEKVGGNLSIKSIRSPSLVLLDPFVHKMAKRIGPAAYHILAHYAFGVQKMPDQIQKTFFLNETTRKDCGSSINADVLLINKLADLETALGSKSVIYPVGYTTGWIISLLKGETPIIHDHVPKTCFKAANYSTTGLVPVYSGVQRSTSDLVRSNYICPDFTPTMEMIQYML